MGVGRMFLGLGIVLFGVIFMLNSTQALFLIDNKEQKIILFENITTGTTINLNFTFDRDYIYEIYHISEGERIYKNYLNIYCEDFKDNATVENLTYIQFNDNFYLIENKSYETSLIIVEETLNKKLQELEIKKSSGLTINKIVLEYKGADYEKTGIYETSVFLLSMLIIFFGIIMGLYQE